jgi:hypothetical protein
MEKYRKDIQKLGNLNEEDETSYTLKIESSGFKLSPKIKIFDSSNNELTIKYLVLDKEILFEDGYLKICESISSPEILEFSNKLIAMFNIFSIPFDFFRFDEIILFGDATFVNGTDGKIFVIDSTKANLRGVGYAVLQMQENDFMTLLSTTNLVWKSVKENEILCAGNIFIFLGYGRYYHFHKDYLLAFANTWMFIEAIINLMWEKMMLDVGFTKKQLKDKNIDWSLQVKIDELLLLGRIDKKTNEKAQKLRSKRNKVFHVSKDVKSRTIDCETSKDCIDLGLSLFYQNTDFIDSGYIISFDNLALSVEQCIHKRPFNRSYPCKTKRLQ